MNPGTKNQFRKRLKKKLYHFLLDLNDMKFRKYRPLVFLLVFAVIFLLLAKLPTPETTREDSAATLYGASVAASIRSSTSTPDTPDVDIVALFLPNDLSLTDSSGFFEETLYSFYLTGQEIRYLTEGAIIADNDSVLYLDGLQYTYHEHRLPLDRVTALSMTSGMELLDNALYHIISTEEIFSMFHYISYRSIGIMTIYPKDVTGTPLSSPQEIMLTRNSKPVTIQTALAAAAVFLGTQTAVPTKITVQSGFNIIDLINKPNQITICILALLITLSALLAYILPRLRRIRVWFRIYRIRSKKRSSHTLHGIKKRY